MSSTSRRDFLRMASASSAVLLPGLSASALAAAPHHASNKLRFVFFTDTHLQPELRGDEGTALALAKIKSLRPDFCIQGGDHCFDTNAVPRERSVRLLESYARVSHALDGIPVHHAIGNHDVFGLRPDSGVKVDDPLYGRRAFEAYFDRTTYYSFDQGGYHFIVLDSVGITPDRFFEARIDAEQISWLRADLAATSPHTPIIVTTHCPLVSSAAQYGPPFAPHSPASPAYQTLVVANAFEVLPLFGGCNVIAVLQGHTHINETVYWRGVPYITSGAVCGNWWKGIRWGTPEGFTVVELAGGKIRWHYETYGWQATNPEASPYPPMSQSHVSA